MIYFFETHHNPNDSISQSLVKIYGINNSSSLKLCKKLGFSTNLKITHLTKENLYNLIKIIESSDIMINSDLKNYKIAAINNLINIKSYRGLRKLQKLPVRGQRTHTNSKTCKRVFH
jgi:small subunit ribosomal protein S13